MEERRGADSQVTAPSLDETLALQMLYDHDYVKCWREYCCADDNVQSSLCSEGFSPYTSSPQMDYADDTPPELRYRQDLYSSHGGSDYLTYSSMYYSSPSQPDPRSLLDLSASPSDTLQPCKLWSAGELRAPRRTQRFFNRGLPPYYVESGEDSHLECSNSPASSGHVLQTGRNKLLQQSSKVKAMHVRGDHPVSQFFSVQQGQGHGRDMWNMASSDLSRGVPPDICPLGGPHTLDLPTPALIQHDLQRTLSFAAYKPVSPPNRDDLGVPNRQEFCSNATEHQAMMGHGTSMRAQCAHQPNPSRSKDSVEAGASYVVLSVQDGDVDPAQRGKDRHDGQSVTQQSGDQGEQEDRHGPQSVATGDKEHRMGPGKTQPEGQSTQDDPALNTNSQQGHHKVMSADGDSAQSPAKTERPPSRNQIKAAKPDQEAPKQRKNWRKHCPKTRLSEVKSPNNKVKVKKQKNTVKQIQEPGKINVISPKNQDICQSKPKSTEKCETPEPVENPPCFDELIKNAGEIILNHWDSYLKLSSDKMQAHALEHARQWNFTEEVEGMLDKDCSVWQYIESL